MNKGILRSLTILTLLIASFAIMAWVVSFVRAQASQQPSPNVNSGRRKTLREVAQERDVESTVPEFEGNNEYDDLHSLAKAAHAIVLGQIMEEKSSFDESGEFVHTTYKVNIQRVLKEPKLDLPPDYVDPYWGKIVAAPLITPLIVERDGGEVKVNGHRVSKKLKGSELLTTGNSYVFFLGWNSPTAYRIAAGASGAFLVDDNFRVKALGSGKGIKKRDGTDLNSFINELLNGQ